jgi:hypothetical protein
MKNNDKKLNNKSVYSATRNKKAMKKKKNLTIVDKVKNTVTSINKDTIVDFAKANAKTLIAVGTAVAVTAIAGTISANKRVRRARAKR